MSYHEPVLLQESIDALAIVPGGTYVDATFGGGGHSKEILKRLQGGKLFAFDQDTDSMNNSTADKRLTLINHNFRYLKRFLRFHDALRVNGIIADLGISSHQIDDPLRGFSTRHEGIPDMRMNRRIGTLTAERIINTYPAEWLQRVLSEYGELSGAGRITEAILSARPITTTLDLKGAVARFAGGRKENQFHAKLFQALRIEVNDELNALKDLLVQSAEVLVKGGRIVIISYHSLEDRLVKTFFSKGKFGGETEKDIYGNPLAVPFRPLTRKPVLTPDAEVERNPRARSAKMRIAEKI